MSKLILALISVASFAQVPKELSSTVTILVVDYLGNVIPARLERFTLEGTAVELATHFQGLKGTEIPFGKYEFILRRTGLSASTVRSGAEPMWKNPRKQSSRSRKECHPRQLWITGLTFLSASNSNLYRNQALHRNPFACDSAALLPTRKRTLSWMRPVSFACTLGSSKARFS